MKLTKNSFWKDKRVAVTGASGFLGNHFVIELEKLEANVKKVTRDTVNLLDFDQTKEALQDIEIIINCAALDGNTQFKTEHAAEILDSNFRIVSNILNSAKANDIKEVVLISSSEIYSSYAPNPVKEEDDYNLYGGHTSNGYILSKRFSEILADLYSEEFGLNIYIPRPTNIFGPGDHFGDQSTRVIPSFIHKITTGKPIEIWGDGSQTRQFVYVKDVVHITLEMVEKRKTGKMNISTDESVSILKLAKKVSEYLKLEPDIRLDMTKSIGSKSRLLSITKMKELTDCEPTTLDDGLSKTIAWYIEKTKE